jgi:hypothetical protein
MYWKSMGGQGWFMGAWRDLHAENDLTHPGSFSGLARQFAELHNLIHQQDGAGLPLIRPALNTMVQRSDTFLKDLPGIVMQTLQNLPDGNALCHFDFHPDQVMMTRQGPVILDWMNASQGHPMADVARTDILMMLGHEPYGGPMMRAFIDMWRNLFRKAYLSRYFSLHPGTSQDDLVSWFIPVAVGRLGENIDGEKEALLGIIAESARKLVSKS